MNYHQRKFRHDQESRRMKSVRSLYNAEALVLNDSNRSECRIGLRPPSWCQGDVSSVWESSSHETRTIPITCCGWTVHAGHTNCGFTRSESRHVHHLYYYHRNASDIFRNQSHPWLPNKPNRPSCNNNSSSQSRKRQKQRRLKSTLQSECIFPFHLCASLTSYRPFFTSSVSIILIVTPMTSMNIGMSSCQSPCSK